MRCLFDPKGILIVDAKLVFFDFTNRLSRCIGQLGGDPEFRIILTEQNDPFALLHYHGKRKSRGKRPHGSP